MINPVNSEKNIQTTTDKSSQSHAKTQTNPATAPSEQLQQAHAPSSNPPTLEVENARQLYEMETARSESAAAITTPKQARSLLGTLVQQFASSPESAAKAQLGHITKPLANLLASAPA